MCRANTGTSPMVQPVPETSRLRVALEDFHMNLCTSRDAPAGCSEHSRPTEAEKDSEIAKQALPGPRMKGQKAIENFFIRAPGSGSGSSERHDHAAAGAAAADGEGMLRSISDTMTWSLIKFPRPGMKLLNDNFAEANGTSDKKVGVTATVLKKGTAAGNAVPSTTQLRRDLDLLTAEKATLQGELKHERELRYKQQQVLPINFVLEKHLNISSCQSLVLKSNSIYHHSLSQLHSLSAFQSQMNAP